MGAQRRNIMIYGGGILLIAALIVPLARMQHRSSEISRAPDDLYAAIVARDLAGVRQALEHGADPNMLPVGSVVAAPSMSNAPAPQVTAITPLCLAAQLGESVIVHALLEAGADPDDASSTGMPPLIWAIMYQKSRVAAVLIQGGADVKIESQYGRPIDVALRYSQPHLLDQLLHAGVEVNGVSAQGDTPLMVAAGAGTRWGNWEPGDDPVSTLLDLGADPNLKGQGGVTALHVAAQSWFPARVTLLLEAGADVNARDDYGLTPLSCVQQWRTGGAATLLLDAGADVDVPVFTGISIIHLAAGSGDTDMVRRLVNAGVDPHAVDTQGQTTLHYAASILNIATVEFLVNLGVDVEARDASGLTALDYALEAAQLHLKQTPQNQAQNRAFMDRLTELLAGESPDEGGESE